MNLLNKTILQIKIWWNSGKQRCSSSSINAAQSNFEDTNRNLSYTQVKAPVNGRIGIIDVTVGNYVTPSSGSLTTINSTNPIYVTFPLSSEDYAALSSIDKKADENAA